jgi:hypothetical protein
LCFFIFISLSNILSSGVLPNVFCIFVSKLTKNYIMQRDTQIFDLILEEQDRQIHGLELIASENFVSDQVMEAAGFCPNQQVC